MTDSIQTEQTSVAKSASHMGFATLCSRILGLVREQIFAFLFGASDATDAFNIAFRIPNLLRDLFAEGAMSAAFVPNFTRALVRSQKHAFELLSSVLVILTVGLSILSALGIVFSHQLVSLYASSFHKIPGKFELSVELTRMMFPFFPLVAMAAVVMGALNALGYFFLPAFAPVLFNVASIVCGITLCPFFAHHTSFPPIYGMAIGVVLGGFLQFYIQWWKIRKQGFVIREVRHAILHPWKVSGTKSVLWLLVPGTVGLAATQLNILINSIYATSQGTGAVSWLNYAFRLMQFPIGLFGVSIAVATLPQVSKKLALGQSQAAALALHRSLKMTFVINGPAAAGLMALGLPIIQLLFQHGKFQWTDSQNTTSALFWYALGLPAYSAVKVLVPVFYALGSTQIPVAISFGAVGLNAFLNHIFLNVYHFPFWALAIATSVTSIFNACLLFFWISKKLPGSVNLKLIGSLIVHVVLSIAVGISAWGCLTASHWVEIFFSHLPYGSFLFWGFQVIMTIMGASIVWFGVGHLFRIEEISATLKFFREKFWVSKKE